MFFLPLSTKYFKTSLMKRILPLIFILTIILAGCGSSKKQLQKDPIGAQSNFENIYSRALGDTQALNAKQLERTRSKELPFPSDLEMVMRCSESLKKAINGGILNNRRFIY